MTSVKALLRRDSGQLTHAANHLDTKFDGVKADISRLEKRLKQTSVVSRQISAAFEKRLKQTSVVSRQISAALQADISRVEKKLEDCQ
ncbi:hypothetical protein L873DRAFT_1823305, partial [Choiromyces venosus 120613-1]